MSAVATAVERNRLGTAGLLAVLTGGLVIASLIATMAGPVPVDWNDWLALFVAERTGGALVLWEIRLPRVMLAAIVGASLGLTGALTQGLFRNPLADPGLLGITAGAVCGAALVLTTFSAVAAGLPSAWRPWVLPAAAFAGALGVSRLLHWVAGWLTPGSIAGLLLTGLALNALAMAVVGLCTYVATDEQLRSLTFWTLGSLTGGSWSVVLVLILVLMAGSLQSVRLADRLNALALGTDVAQQVGIDVTVLRARVTLTVAGVLATAVAWCGLIGFISLMAPHLVRALAGADHRSVVPLSAVTGALLLVVSDTVARTVASPAELPVGIVTALFGAPAFLLLLHRVATRQSGFV